jgi:hemoglobin
MLTDIRNIEDITRLVDAFYDKVLRDEVLRPFFADLDFEHHKPLMVHFWSFVLLDVTGYTTNVFDKHAHMPLKDQHFDRWITLFEATVREMFNGEKADTAILRAKTIAWTFKEKFKHLDQ